MAGTRPSVAADTPVPITDERDRAIVAALSVDGRTPLSGLAAAAGTSESTVRRRLNLLLATNVVRLRCELARDARTAR